MAVAKEKKIETLVDEFDKSLERTIKKGRQLLSAIKINDSADRFTRRNVSEIVEKLCDQSLSIVALNINWGPEEDDD